jgi:hypothetical protein
MKSMNLTMREVGRTLTINDALNYTSHDMTESQRAAEMRSSDSAMAFELEDCLDEIDMWEGEIF